MREVSASVSKAPRPGRKPYAPPEFDSVPISQLVKGGSGAGNDASRGFDANNPNRPTFAG